MRLCDNEHDEIASDESTRYCPVCKALDELADAKDQIKELEAELEKAEKAE